MPYSTFIAVLLASSAATLEEELREQLLANQDRFTEAVLKYLLGEVTPQSTLQFEMELAAAARELAREVTEWTCNHLEPDDPEELLTEIWDEVRDAMLKSIPSPVQATPAPQARTITQNAA